MRALVVLDSIWIAVLLVAAVVLYREGAERQGLRDEAARIRRELAQIERAVERAAETETPDNRQPISFERYREFLEGGGKRLREKGLDPLGNAYGAQVPGLPPSVPARSAESLRGIVGPDFWDPYPVADP